MKGSHTARSSALMFENQQELESYQQSDYEVIASHFRAAGIKVKSNINLKGTNN